MYKLLITFSFIAKGKRTVDEYVKSKFVSHVLLTAVTLSNWVKIWWQMFVAPLKLTWTFITYIILWSSFQTVSYVHISSSMMWWLFSLKFSSQSLLSFGRQVILMLEALGIVSINMHDYMAAFWLPDVLLKQNWRISMVVLWKFDTVKVKPYNIKANCKYINSIDRNAVVLHMDSPFLFYLHKRYFATDHQESFSFRKLHDPHCPLPQFFQIKLVLLYISTESPEDL